MAQVDCVGDKDCTHVTQTLPFRGQLESVESWSLGVGSSATLVHAATGVVVAQDLPVGLDGVFSAAVESSVVGRLIAQLVRLGGSSARIELEVRIQAPGAATSVGLGQWSPTASLASTGPVSFTTTRRGSGDGDASEYEVYGVITGADSTTNARVQVLVPGSPTFSVVGTTQLGEDGSYRVAYETSGSSTGPDRPILVRVLARDGVRLHESGSLCRVPAVFEYDAQLGAPLARPTLFSRFRDAQAQIPEDGSGLSASEIDAIACLLQVEPDDVRRFYLALTFERGGCPGVPGEVVFGVAHGAGVVEEAALRGLDLRALGRHLARAVAARAVSALDTDDPLPALARCIADGHLEPETRSPIGDVVASLGLTSISGQDFLRSLLFEHDGTREAYLSAFEAQAPVEEARTVRFAFDLWPLLGDVDVLVAMLRRRSDTLSFAQDAASLTEGQWRGVLAELDRDHTHDGAVAEAYAVALEQAYPTHAALYRLEGEGRFTAASAYLRANPSLDLIRDRVREFVGRDSTTATTDAVVDELHTVQRLLRIVPSVAVAPSVRALVDANYTSAMAIAKTPWHRFRAGLDAQTPDPTARAIYQGARRSAMWVLNAVVSVQQARFQPGFKILEPEEAPDDGDGIDLRGLFDSLDSCFCEPCRSVLSPAAYLVALLEFVHDQVSAAAYQELIARRPWIADTLLDCDNAMTPMSKLDLINELLEFEVSPPVGGRPAPQTTWAAQRLTAEPEHLDRQAYDVVGATTLHPWDLPFDLDAEEIETLLQPVGVGWGELLSAFETTQAASVRGAWLGLSAAGIGLVEAAADDRPGPRWNDDFPVAGVPGGVARFLETTKTDLAHFHGLAGTWFVGRFGLEMDWASDDDPCSLQDARLRPSATFEACIVAVERFERLRLATGWSVVELDEALQAFAPASLGGQIPASSTAALAALEVLVRRFEGVGRSEITTWFRTPTHPRIAGQESAFELLFGPPDRFETLGGTQTQWLEVIAGAIGSDVGVVREVFGAGEDGSLPEVASGALPLSRFKGLQGLAKALGSTLSELAAFTRLSGVQPFGTSPASATEANIAEAPVAVLSFLELWDRWSWVGADLAEVTAALDVTSTDAVTEAEGFFWALEQARVEVAASIDPEQDASPNDRAQRLLPRLLPRLLDDDAAAELVEVLVRPRSAAPLSLVYPEWVDVATLGAALAVTPVDEASIANVAEELVDRAVALLGATARAAAYARLAQQVVEGSFVPAAVQEPPTPTDDDRALLGRARLLRALAPLALGTPWLELVFAEPQGWLRASDLDGSVQTELSTAFTAWLRIAAAVAFDRPSEGKFRRALSAQVQSEDGEAAPWDAVVGSFVSMTETDVVAALSGASVSVPPTSAELFTLRAAQQLSERVGASVSRMRAWAQGATSPSAATVSSVRDAVRSRFEPALWYAKSAGARDRLRARQRDALVSYLMARGSNRQGERDFSTAQRISDALLIDVQSEACQTTSRIVEATLAVQLFVFRLQLRLEPAVLEFPESAARQWTWLKNYRVWEAAKKIFLFPENYLEADFRADKTPLFESFVSTLGSSNTDDELADEAFTTYAEGLHAISFLRPAGVVYDDGHADPAKNILHVLAHDRSDPPTYFHRQRVLGRWSPWEEVPGAMPNRGVLPVVRRGRLALYWPSIEPEELRVPDAPQDARPWQSAKVALSWVERTGEGWQAERRSVDKLSAASMKSTALLGEGLEDHLAKPEFYALHEDPDDPNALELAVEVPYPSLSQSVLGFIGSFRAGGCSGEWSVLQASDLSHKVDPLHTARRGQRFRFWGDAQLDSATFVADGMTYQGNFDRLVRTPRPYEYVFERRGTEGLALRPFLFTDSERSFLVTTWFRARRPAREPGFDLGTETAREVRLPELARLASVVGGASGSANGALPEAILGSDQPGVERVWRFVPFSHELTCDVVDALRQNGVDGLFNPELPSILGRQRGYLGPILEGFYEPSENVVEPFPERTFDFEPGSPYGTYNWELFFHAPAFTALQLASQGKFAEAQRWWHYIFNPREPYGNVPTGSRRFWRVKPLAVDTGSIEDILQNLAAGDEGDEALRVETLAALEDWINHPFDAHAVAARRPGSYQRWVVARYLDLLIAWGDSLYRQSTRESINEAAQLYVIAAQLLGPKPQRLPGRPADPRSYRQLRASLDASGNALVELENAAPLLSFANTLTLDAALPQATAAFPTLRTHLYAAAPNRLFARAPSEGPQSTFVGPPAPEALREGEQQLELASVVAVLDDLPLGYRGADEPQSGLYFCIPPNPVFDQYWDKVGQRLFNIRNCRDLDGNVRELALFAPPIDPKLLARATASGLDVGSAISELSAPVPLYRFRVALGLAKEVAAEVKALGSAMLGALQAADSEELAQVRARQEVRNLDQIRTVRETQIEEAQAAIAALEAAKTVAADRAQHYRDLFGGELPFVAPTLIGDARVLEAEAQQRDQLKQNLDQLNRGGKLSMTAGIISQIPDFDLGFSLGGHATVVLGGRHLAAAINAAATLANTRASRHGAQSSLAGLEAAQTRREQDWYLQMHQAEGEVTRLKKDLIAAQIRLQLAQHELDNHEFAREQSQAVETYLTGRFTNAELHRWMAGELAATYAKAYGFALDLARRAQRCFQFELGRPGVNFVRSGQFIGQRKGLLAGNELVADLQRLEAEYLASNTREYELVKNVSLAEIDPWALIQLRETGQCQIGLHEALFDLDHPGHYFRRIRMVRVSLPTVTGPYVSTAGRLTLLSSQIRTEGVPGSELFSVPPGGTSSIALSTGQGDSGMHEPNLRDDRYLPFEGKGAVSQWSLRLPRARSFDYASISDVVLEISYTAREGDPAFRDAVEDALSGRLLEREHVGAPDELPSVGPTRAWSLAAAFPEALVALAENAEATLVLPASAVPLRLSGEGPAEVLASTLVLFGAPQGASVSLSTDPEAEPVATAGVTLSGGQATTLQAASTGSGDWVGQPLTLRVSASGAPIPLEDIVLLLTFGA